MSHYLMDELNHIKKENERLKNLVEEYRDKEKRRWETRWWIAKKSSSVFIGRRLKDSIKKALTEISKEHRISADTLAELMASAFWRFTRIGLMGLIIALLPTVILVLQTALLNKQNQKIDLQNQFIENQNHLIERQSTRLDQQTYLQEADRRGSLVFLFSNIMDQIDKEIKSSKNRELSAQLVGRIIALSSRLKPYKYLEGDSLIDSPLSPERGQLLVSLLESRLSDRTYQQIFSKANFSYADLKLSTLDSFKIDGVNLMYADFTDANLAGTVLTNSNLIGTQFINCYMSGIDLSSSNLNFASIRANLSKAILNRTYFTNMNELRCSFLGATISDCSFNNSKLAGSDFSGAEISSSDFEYSKFDSTLISNPNWFHELRESNDLEPIDSLEKRYSLDKYEEPSNGWMGKYILLEKKSMTNTEAP